MEIFAVRPLLFAAVLAAAVAAPALAVSPHNSINPEKPKPTPYGLDIVRSVELEQVEPASTLTEQPPGGLSEVKASDFWGVIEGLGR